jgi:hypothetical protein
MIYKPGMQGLRAAALFTCLLTLHLPSVHAQGLCQCYCSKTPVNIDGVITGDVVISGQSGVFIGNGWGSSGIPPTDPVGLINVDGSGACSKAECERKVKFCSDSSVTADHQLSPLRMV